MIPIYAIASVAVCLLICLIVLFVILKLEKTRYTPIEHVFSERREVFENVVNARMELDGVDLQSVNGTVNGIYGVRITISGDSGFTREEIATEASAMGVMELLRSSGRMKPCISQVDINKDIVAFCENALSIRQRWIAYIPDPDTTIPYVELCEKIEPNWYWIQRDW